MSTRDTPETIHLRCGSDIAPTLRAAGFVGRFVEFSDPLLQGPLAPARDMAHWIAARDAFVVDAFDAAPGAIAAQYDALAHLPQNADLRLWFEHDLYDQAILVFLLSRWADDPPPRLRLICVDQVHGVANFRGLGQLSPDQLAALWTTARRPVSRATFALARAAWAALQAPTPQALAAIAADATPDLPPLAAALRRRLEELPGVADDLAQSERAVVDAVGAQPDIEGVALFRALITAEAAPFFTDLILRNALSRLAPLIDAAPTDAPWPKRRYRLSAAGEAVRAGAARFFDHAPAARWVGGVEIRPPGPVWRWDAAAGAPVFS